MTLNFQNFDYLSFDCYGTLINWEKGILGAAAIAAGLGFPACSSDSTQPASVQPAFVQSLECCDHRNILCTTGAVCPSGSSIQYAWLCPTHDGSHYQCIDCYNDSNIYVCSYTLKTQ